MTYTFSSTSAVLTTGNTTDAGLADGNGNPYPGPQTVINTLSSGNPFASSGHVRHNRLAQFLDQHAISKLGRIRTGVLQFCVCWRRYIR